MDSLLVILFLISFISIPMGIIKPGMFTKTFKRPFTRLKAGTLSTVLTFIFFILIGIFAKSTESSVTSQTNTSKDNGLANESTQTTIKQVQPVTQKEAEHTYLVTRVIDGDTIEIEGGTRIRYIGIDTPETVKPNTAVQCFGKEASNKNKELVEGKRVTLEKDVSETDSFGRLLRYVYVNGTFVNDVLVREGYAHAVSYTPDVKYQETFKVSQQEAYANNSGLWSSCNSKTTTETQKQEQKEPATTTVIVTPTKQPISQKTSPKYSCDCKKTCPNISSCEEAQYLLNTCGCSARDGDNDGIACDKAPLNCEK